MAAHSRRSLFALALAVVLGVLASCGDGADPRGAESPPRPASAVPPPATNADCRADGAPGRRADESPRARADASAAGSGGEPTEPALPSTPKALADLLLAGESLGERESDARDALAEHGAAAVPELIRLLSSERHAGWACVCLQELGAEAAPAATALAKCVETDVVHRGAAAWALVRVGSEGAVAALRLVASDDIEVSGLALDTIGRIQWVPPESESVILAAVRDPDPAVRRTAAFALRAVSVQRGAAVGALISLLGDDSGYVRHGAIETIRKKGEFADEVRSRAGELVAYAERVPDEAWAVALILSDLGPAAMLRGLRSESAEVRARLAPYADPNDDDIRARLTELLGDPSPDVSLAAFRGLATLDAPPAAVAKIAAELLAAPRRAPASADAGAMMQEIHARELAVGVMASLVRRGERPAEALLASLDDPWSQVRMAAAVALAQSAGAADLDRALTAVRPLWRDDVVPTGERVALAAAVGARQGRGSETVEWLASLADSGGGCRVEAITALGGIDDPAAVTTLLAQLDVVIVDVRTAAIAALGGHARADARAVPALVDQLRTARRPEFRAAAATALQPVRDRADVREALTAARSDRSSVVREACEASLRE